MTMRLLLLLLLLSHSRPLDSRPGLGTHSVHSSQPIDRVLHTSMETLFYRVMTISLVAILASLLGKFSRFCTHNKKPYITAEFVIDISTIIIIR